MEILIDVFQNLAVIIKEMMKALTFPLKIDTDISWGVIVAAVVIYWLVSGYLEEKKKLTSSQLIILILAYMGILSVVAIYYADVDKLLDKLMYNQAYYRSIFPVMAGIFFVFVLLIGWLGASDVGSKMEMILLILSAPMIILILSNGRVLYEGAEIMKDFTPQMKIPFKTPPGKAEDLRLCCNWLNPREVEGLINEHPAVVESAVFIYQREDHEIEPCAFIVLNPSKAASVTLAKSIRTELYRKNLEEYKIPRVIKFVTQISKTAGGDIRRDKFPETTSEEIEDIINEHSAVAESAVIFYQNNDKIITPHAFVVLKPGKGGSDREKAEIRASIRKRFDKNKVGLYKIPHTIEFIDEIPKLRAEEENVKQNELRGMLLEKLEGR